MKILPIYQALLKKEEDGIFCVSLVDEPATESNFMLFKKDVDEMQKYSIQDDEKHLVSGVIMLANTPIYRRQVGYEFYVMFDRETLEGMAQRMLANGFQKNVSVQHNGVLVDGVSLVEIYIKDSEKGIVPNFIDDVPDGTLMGTYKVENDEIWDAVKSGKFKGFSIEVLNSFEYTGIDMEKFNKQKKSHTTMAKLKEKLKKLLMEFASIETDKGTLNYDELVVGAEVFDENDEPAADGEYEAEDKFIVVADGKITEIRDKVVEDVQVEVEAEDEEPAETPAEEPAEEPAETPAEETAEIAEEEREIDRLRRELDELKETVAAMREELDALTEVVNEIANTPAAESVIQEFKHTKELEKTGNSKIDNLLRVVKA